MVAWLGRWVRVRPHYASWPNEARSVFRAHASWRENSREIEAWIIKRQALLNPRQVARYV